MGLWIKARYFSETGGSRKNAIGGVGARGDADERRLREAYREGDADRVRSLRRDPHLRDDDCWLHADDYCISYREPDA